MFAIVVVGDAGVGKTTFARQLARSVGAALVDIDTCTQATVEAGLKAAGLRPDDRDSPSYKALFRLPVHDALFAIANEQLFHSGLNCVLVAPFTTERKRPDFVEFLRLSLTTSSSQDLTVFVVHCVCDSQVRRQRIEQRGLVRDAAKFRDNAQYFQANFTSEPLRCEHFRIDTTLETCPSLTGPWTPYVQKPKL